MFLGACASQGEVALTQDVAGSHMHDWDWYVGRWRVRHRRLTQRLVGGTAWEEFAGQCSVWKTLGGAGNVDDNILDMPSGQYRAMTIRAFDAATERWAIWWLDGRSPHTIEAPVYGRFDDGVGLFLGDDTLGGRPIKVRFQWLDIETGAPRWEQSFSGDGGHTWETNWIMRFERDE